MIVLDSLEIEANQGNIHRSSTIQKTALALNLIFPRRDTNFCTMEKQKCPNSTVKKHFNEAV